MQQIRLLGLFFFAGLLNSCAFFIKGDTATYLEYPKNIPDREKLDISKLVVYPLETYFDTSDVSSYRIDGFRYDAGSIDQLFERFGLRFKKFWLGYDSVRLMPTYSSSLSNMIKVNIFQQPRPFVDANDHSARRSISRVNSNVFFRDTFYHLIAEATFRIDNCIGCASGDFRYNLFAVLHFRYAILNRDKVYYYRELIVPKPLDNTKRNVSDRNALTAFGSVLDNVALFYFRRDIDRLMKHKYTGRGD